MKNLKNLCIETNNNIHKLPNKPINKLEKKKNIENILPTSFYNSLNNMSIFNLNESQKIQAKKTPKTTIFINLAHYHFSFITHRNACFGC